MHFLSKCYELVIASARNEQYKVVEKLAALIFIVQILPFVKNFFSLMMEAESYSETLVPITELTASHFGSQQTSHLLQQGLKSHNIQFTIRYK